eukprot:g8421.t1
MDHRSSSHLSEFRVPQFYRRTPLNNPVSHVDTQSTEPRGHSIVSILDETRKLASSSTRSLHQISRDSQEEGKNSQTLLCSNLRCCVAEYSCGLSLQEVDSYYNSLSNQWLLNDTVLEMLENDIQAIVECTAENDVVILETTNIVKPQRTITVYTNLTFIGRSASDFIQDRSETRTSMTFTCPDKGELIISKSPSLRIENISFSNCKNADSLIVLDPVCRRRETNGQTLIVDVAFEDNKVPLRSRLVDAGGAICTRLILDRVVVGDNQCSGSECIELPLSSVLRELDLNGNSGSANTSIFSAPVNSNTAVLNSVSRRNKIRSFSVSKDSTLTLQSSRFVQNKREVVLSKKANDALGGGVLIADQASVAIRDCIFKRNSAVHGGVLFTVASNITTDNCRFSYNNAGEGDGGVIYADVGSSFNLSSSVCHQNKAFRGGVLFSNLTHTVRILDVKFEENQASWGGCMNIRGGSMSMDTCEFVRNSATVGNGAIMTSSATLLLTNSIFIENRAPFGGACVFQLKSMIEAQNLHFIGNDAYRTNGAGVYLSSGSSMRLTNASFLNNTATGDAGAIKCIRSNAIIQKTEFSGNTARRVGGSVAVYFGSFTGEDLTYINNSAVLYGGALIGDEGATLSLLRTLFQDNTASSGGAIMLDNQTTGDVIEGSFVRNKCNDYGGSIYVLDSNLNVSSSSFSYGSARYGGSIATDTSTASINNSNFTNCRADGGGVIHASSTSLEFTVCSFTENEASFLSGVMQATNNTKFVILSSVFIRNSARTAGVLHASRTLHSMINDCKFENNSATEAIGVASIMNTDELSIHNSSFTGNTARSYTGAIWADLNSKLSISQSSFDHNRALRSGCITVLDSSHLRISRSNFTNNEGMRGDSGGAISFATKSNVSISQSIFSGNKNRFGGVIYGQDSFALISTSVFYNNSASVDGGVGALERCIVTFNGVLMHSNVAINGGSLITWNTSLQIFNSRFQSNHALEHGGALYFLSSNVIINRTGLRLNSAESTSGGIYAAGNSHLNLKAVSVFSNSAADGGGIGVDPGSSIFCNQCRLKNNRASIGAGVYISTNHNAFIAAQFQDSLFENNTANLYGGGVMFLRPQNTNVNCSNPDVVCSHMLLLNTTFLGNYAGDTGAVVMLSDSKSVLVSCGPYNTQDHSGDFISHLNFSTLQYIHPEELCPSWRGNQLGSEASGNVVGTLGRKILVSINDVDKIKLREDSRVGLVFESVKSGENLPVINITILDDFGVGPAPTIPSSFEVRISSFDGFFNGFYSKNIAKGTGQFSGISGFVSPGNYSLQIIPSITGIELVNLRVHVRGCLINEEPTSSTQLCEECNALSYNFNTSKVDGCSTCPDTANCEGRYIVPKNGYWHQSPCQTKLKECLIEEACSYSNREQTLTNTTSDSTNCNFNKTTLDSYSKSQCAKGYKGVLCGSCLSSFGLTLKSLCVKCPHKLLSILALIGVPCYLLILASFTIRGSLPSSKMKLDEEIGQCSQSNNQVQSSCSDKSDTEGSQLSKSEDSTTHNVPESTTAAATSEKSITPKTTTTLPAASSSYQTMDKHELAKWKMIETLKVLINFLQVTAAAAAIRVRWTDGLIGMFEAADYGGSLTSGVFSQHLDCLLSSSSSSTRAALRILFNFLIPLVIIGILVLFWTVLSYRKEKNMSYLWKRAMLSAITVVYVSYLGLTLSAVRVFYCVDVKDSDNPFEDSQSSYWAVDTSIRCFRGRHLTLIGISVLILSIVSACFPLISAIILLFNKTSNGTHNPWVSEAMGFLFRAFKDRFLFWESLVMLRKACLSLVVVFGYPLGAQVQSLLAIYIVAFALYIHLRCRPFRKEFNSLNYYEETSLIASCFTFIAGQFFEAETCSDTTRAIIAATILSVNISVFLILLSAFFQSILETLRTSLESQGFQVDEDTTRWMVLKIYSASKLSKAIK